MHTLFEKMLDACFNVQAKGSKLAGMTLVDNATFERLNCSRRTALPCLILPHCRVDIPVVQDLVSEPRACLFCTALSWREQLVCELRVTPAPARISLLNHELCSCYFIWVRGALYVFLLEYLLPPLGSLYKCQRPFETSI